MANNCLDVVAEAIASASARLPQEELANGWNEEKRELFLELLLKIQKGKRENPHYVYRGGLARELSFWGILDGHLLLRAAAVDSACRSDDS